MRFLPLLFALLAAGPAFSQPAPATTERAATERLGEQLATLLVNPVQRGAALDLTLVVAELRPEVNLRPTVDALLAIYAEDPDVRHRRAAAVALAAIGDVTSMEQLAERTRFEENEAVRRTTVQLLSTYVATLPAHKAEALDFYIAD